MAFNYQTLRRITGTAIVDGSLSDRELGDASATGIKVADGSVDANKLATNAVNLGTATTTGTLPLAKGGTAITSVGSSGQMMQVNSSNNGLTYGNHGIYGMQVFTSGGTWNKPSGVRYIKVQVQGGGGGGSGHGESGGAGGYSERVIDVTGVNSVSVSVSGETGGTWYFGRGGNGGTSSFGNYCSASGGRGANRNNSHSGGLAGSGSGGNLNIYGGGGQPHHTRSSVGGECYWGGGVAAGHPNGGNFSHNHQSHSTPGSGGAGGYFHGHRGSNGRPGLVVVTMYY
jgi:hypothetical protein